MHLHPKVRRAAKWGGLTTSMLFAITWLGSGWVGVTWGLGRGWMLEISYGEAALGRSTMNGMGLPAQFQIDAPLPEYDLTWQPQWVDLQPFPNCRFRSAHLPLYLPLLATAAVTAAVWRRGRETSGACVRCGYSLAGQRRPGPCPECGQTAPAPTPGTPKQAGN